VPELWSGPATSTGGFEGGGKAVASASLAVTFFERY
jgi:hypothetical protein